MAKITLGKAPETLDVDIEIADRVFSLRPITRSVEALLNVAETNAQQATSGDDLVAAFAETLDALLIPQDGQRKKAGAFISEQWQADTFGLPQIETFMRQVQEAAAAGRPT